MDLDNYWFTQAPMPAVVADPYSNDEPWKADYGSSYYYNAPTFDVAPSSSWTGFQLTPASIMNSAKTIGQAVSGIASLSLAKDQYAANREIAKANLDAGVQIAKYNAAGSAAKAAGAMRGEQIAAGMMPAPRASSPLLLIALVAGAIYLANQK